MATPQSAPLLALEDARMPAALAGSRCAFGVFDGFHKGHRFIVNEALHAARETDAPCCIITFNIDPDELFGCQAVPGDGRNGGEDGARGGGGRGASGAGNDGTSTERERRAGRQSGSGRSAPKKLMTNARRLEALRTAGADAVVVLPFTREFAALQPADFLARLFGGGAPAGIYVGSDFRFGAKASGTAETLRLWGGPRGMDVHAIELLSAGGSPITSTRIRGLLGACRIEEGNELLGTRHAVSATVESGRGEGAELGFRTANLNIADAFRVLGDGVYGAYACIDGRRFKAAVSLGVPPTFEGTARHNCEAHLLDFDGDLYGRELTLEFARYLRPMRSFPTVDELIATVTANIEWVRANL